MTKERGRKPLSPKELAALREEKEKSRELSPQERQRRMIINFGVGLLLLAFGTTSGITCISSNSTSQAASSTANEDQKAKALSPADAEIERWQGELAKKPNDPSVLANLAFYYVERGDGSRNPEVAKKDYAEAGKHLDAALKVDPGYSFALRLAGKAKMSEGKLDEAQKLCEAALKSSQKPIDAKDPEKAAKENNAKAEQVQDRMVLAELAHRKKNLKETLVQLNEVIKLDPGSLEAYFARAQTLIEDKQPEAARKDLGVVIKISEAMGGTVSLRASQQAQMMLNQLDAGAPNPTASKTPGASGTPTAVATPAPVAMPTVNLPPTPSPATLPTAAPTPVASP